MMTTFYNKSWVWFLLILNIQLSAANSYDLSSLSLLHVKGNEIVDANNIPIQLRGVCFGNEVWTDNALPYTHHTEEDYTRIKNMGMNVVRFYLNYKTFEDDLNPYKYKSSGWEWIDQNIEWAKNNNIYLILNMHVPQGGFQSTGKGGTLWTVPENQRRLKALWYNIAKKYNNETTIAGFDLVNEPVVTNSIMQWQNLAQQLVDTIRSVNKNHIIIVERVNAVANNWSSNENMNYFKLNDNNIVYTFHFYSPIEYTHQNTSWTGLGEGGKYPDESKINTTEQPTWLTATFDNPSLKSGNSDWTYLEGIKYPITNIEIALAIPALVAANTGVNSKIYFDDITVKEYDNNLVFTKEIMHINPSTASDWYYWSVNKDGQAGITNSNGHNDITSLYIKNTSGDANYSNQNKRFIPKQGYYYEISGWAKGENLSENSSCKIRLDFQKSTSPIYSRNKQYLINSLNQFIIWGKQNNVPLYCGEFGLYKDCYENGKGGLEWVSDVVDILIQNKIHFTFHAYHEDSFGIYPGYGTLPNPNLGRAELINIFSEKLK